MNTQRSAFLECVPLLAKHLPVLLWQVGFHVKEGILPLFDLGADLLYESKFFRSSSGLAPAKTQKQDPPLCIFTSFLFKGKGLCHKVHAVKKLTVNLCHCALLSCFSTATSGLALILFRCLFCVIVSYFTCLVYKPASFTSAQCQHSVPLPLGALQAHCAIFVGAPSTSESLRAVSGTALTAPKLSWAPFGDEKPLRPDPINSS